MSTERNVTVIFSGVNPLPSSTGIERDNIKDMKIGDRIKAYCVPVGEGEYKDDPYITFDINDALDHIEKYYGKKFGTTITVTCTTDQNYRNDNGTKYYNITNAYEEGAQSYNTSIGFYAYKVDKGLLMANIWYGSTTMRILNRSNLYSGDGWRLLGPREVSKYVLSDLNGTINPKINPWGLPVNYKGGIHYSFYQMPHNGAHCFIFVNSSIQFGGAYDNNHNGIGWPFIDAFNGSNGRFWYTSFTSLFLYQYVESENATNIYY